MRVLDTVGVREHGCQQVGMKVEPKISGQTRGHHRRWREKKDPGSNHQEQSPEGLRLTANGS